MSLAHSPKIATDGLVLYYDMANKKSFPGKPTTNLLAANGGDTAMERASAVYGYYPVDITAQVQAQWSAGNNVMTYSFEGKRDRMDGGYPCGYVYFSDWSWSFAGGPTSLFWTPHQSTGTMPNPAGKTVYFNIYHMSAGFPGLSYSRNHQLEWGTYATGYTSGTRSNTGAILDLSGKSILTTSSLVYNSDNTFQFDGTNRIPSNIQTFGSNSTWEAWIYPTANGSSYNMFMGRWLPYFAFNGGNSLYFSNIIGGAQVTVQTSATLSLNQWYHAMFTTSYDGINTTMKIYTNGVETATGTYAGAQGNDSNFFSIGDGYQNTWYPFTGKVSMVRVYSRSLTPIEVKQNFNAHRGRYGV